MIKKVFKILVIVSLTYFSIASCTVTTVYVLNESLKDTQSSDLFPN